MATAWLCFDCARAVTEVLCRHLALSSCLHQQQLLNSLTSNLKMHVIIALVQPFLGRGQFSVLTDHVLMCSPPVER